MTLAARTERAMERVVQAQLRRDSFQGRWLKGVRRRLPLVRRLQPQPVDLHDWNHGILYQGLVAFSRRTGQPGPADLVAAIGREQGWRIGEAPWRSLDHPDDFAVGGAYVALASIRSDPGMLEPLRDRIRRVIAAGPPTSPWWIDALAMAPPTWVALACRDADRPLLQLAAVRSLATARALYSPTHQLFFRDSQARQLADQRHRPPVLWGRGNGWAVAGLAQVLAALPAADRRREPLQHLYAEVLAALMSRRTADGQLPSDLLHPQAGVDVSATALLVFAGAHGINSGLLQREQWQASLLFSWEQLLKRVLASGELAEVQPPAAAPGPPQPRSLHPFAAGSVLLAGEEVLRLLAPGRYASMHQPC